MIEVKNLTKVYNAAKKDVKALDDVSVVLPNTGFVAITGENGCGKTTLLNAISTMDDNYTGTILYNGEDYRKIQDSLRSGIISFVFQEKMFVNYLNIRDNIKLFLDNGASEDVISDELKQYNILEKIDENPLCLSGGQAQRASFIRGIIKKSNILLVDEPTSSMNEDMERAVFKKLREISREKLVILVSHNLGMIRNFSDIIIHMDHGKITSCEKNSSNSITYEGNCATVPNGFSSLSSIDRKFVEDSLATVGELRIKVDHQRKEAYVPDYTVDDTPTHHRNKKMTGAQYKKIAFASLLNQKWGLALVTLLCCFFSLITSTLLSFATFKTNEFIYKSLKENVSGSVCFVHDDTIYVGADRTGKYNLTFTDFNNMKGVYGTTGTALLDFEQPLEMSFRATNTIYSNVLSGLAFCTENDVEILEGRFAEADEIMLTDYMADGLMRGSSDYSQYSSILKKGIEIDGNKFKVAGIIKTDYIEYINDYNERSATNKQLYKDYIKTLDCKYQRMYVSSDWGEVPTVIYNVPDELDNLFITVEFTDAYDELYDDEGKKLNACVINTTFANAIGTKNYFKVGGFAADITDVVEDNKDVPVMYLRTLSRENFISSYVSYDSLKIMINLDSVEEIELLMNGNMIHDVSLSNYINETVEVVKTLGNIFVIMFIVLLAVILIMAFVIVNKSLVQDRKLYVFMASAGYGTKDYTVIQLIKMGFVLLGEGIVSCILFYFGTMLANAFLSSSFGYSIFIFEFNPLAMLLPVAAVLVSLVIALAVSIFLLRKTRLIKFIK